MAIHNFSGNKARNNHGVAFGYTSINAGILSSVELGSESTRTGSVVVDGDSTDKAVLAGLFAYNNQSPIARRLTTKLAGVANSVLLKGADQPSLINSIHKTEGVTTNLIATAIRAGYLNIYSGLWSTPPAVSSDSFNNDNAARVGRSNPGRLTFKAGKPRATTVSYKAKN